MSATFTERRRRDAHRIEDAQNPVRHRWYGFQLRALRAAVTGQIWRQHVEAVPGKPTRRQLPVGVIEAGAMHEHDANLPRYRESARALLARVEATSPAAIAAHEALLQRIG